MMETRSWRLTEAVEMTRQCLFSTHPNPQQSKTKCIFMIGKNRNLVKPVPLQLCGRDLPWVESGNHLGNMLHQSGNMEHDASIARAKFIDQSVETRQAFSFASLWRSSEHCRCTTAATMGQCSGTWGVKLVHSSLTLGIRQLSLPGTVPGVQGLT